jgi:hypothetical protein
MLDVASAPAAAAALTGHEALRHALPVHVWIRRQVRVVVAHSARHLAQDRHLGRLRAATPRHSRRPRRQLSEAPEEGGGVQRVGCATQQAASSKHTHARARQHARAPACAAAAGGTQTPPSPCPALRGWPSGRACGTAWARLHTRPRGGRFRPPRNPWRAAPASRTHARVCVCVWWH